MVQPVIAVSDLVKTYRHGLRRRQVEAVRGISLQVPNGAIFGFLGPNGAGKTTTIKVLTGLISATSGTASLFGVPVERPKARRRLGFLPENPYIYPYLTPREFVVMCGELSGLKARHARERAHQTLELVGITYAADRPVRRLSKGMLQRAGLAASLVADPELLILDEPMSGLDPVGRKEVRDLIRDERAHGRTIFFSTHILSDVETLCDEVAILRQGRVVVEGALNQLLKRNTLQFEIVVVSSEALRQLCAKQGWKWAEQGQQLVIEAEGEAAQHSVLTQLLQHNARILSVAPRHETLESLFVREAIGLAN